MKILKTIQYLCRIECLYGYCILNCCDTKICSFYCKRNNNEIVSIDKEWENIYCDDLRLRRARRTRRVCVFLFLFFRLAPTGRVARAPLRLSKNKNLAGLGLGRTAFPGGSAKPNERRALVPQATCGAG